MNNNDYQADYQERQKQKRIKKIKAYRKACEAHNREVSAKRK